jgi:hypothetical protein
MSRTGVKAALRPGFGIATGSDTLVKGGDRLALGGRLLSEQGAVGRNVSVSSGKGIKEAAPATAVGGLRAQVRQGDDRTDRLPAWPPGSPPQVKSQPKLPF